MNRLFLVLAVALIVLTGCKKELTPTRVDEGKFAIVPFDFTYLTAKAKFKYQDGNQKLGVTANFRIKKDSAIWISLSPGLGIEAARVLVNKEGVQMIDKINKSAYSFDYEKLSQQYGVQFTFQLAQALIYGDALFEPEKRRDIQNEKRQFSYTKEEQGFGITHFIGKSSGRLEKLDAYQLGTDNSISVNYTDFNQVDTQRVAHKVRARVKFDDKSKEDAVIDIEFAKLLTQQEPLTFPFHVPDKYTKK
jgi:hypothetical protein